MCPTLLRCAISKSCSSKTKKIGLSIFVSHSIIFSSGLTKPLHSCSNIWPSKHPHMHTFPLPFALLHFNKRCTLFFFLILFFKSLNLNLNYNPFLITFSSTLCTITFHYNLFVFLNCFIFAYSFCLWLKC